MTLRPKDRFGNPRYAGYRREDYKFCHCVPTMARLKDPCKHSVSMQCPSCGGYGEVPKGGEEIK